MKPRIQLGDRAALRDVVRQILPEVSYSDSSAMSQALEALVESLGQEAYAIFFSSLFNVRLSADEAERHWNGIFEHHDEFCRRLGEEVDFRVAALDYLTRKTSLLMNPTIVEAEQMSKLYRDTVTDDLTGLFNHRYFRKMLQRELDRADRYQTPLSLLFFDVDHFKRLNDECGHAVGDVTLQLVAEAIAACVRTSDFACRYGGEEFAVIAPETSKEGAVLLAERIRIRIARLEVPEAEAVERRVTISGGVAAFPVDADSMEGLLKRADAALYAAKRSGRNRIDTFVGERRRSKRLETDFTTSYAILPEVRRRTVTRNISEGGFLLEGEDPMAPGSTVQFQLDMGTEQAPLQCLGKVTHVCREISGQQYRFGVTILHMSREDQGRYRRLILNRAA